MRENSAKEFDMGPMVKSYPVPANEPARLAALHALEILDTARDPEFDAIVALACEMFDVPIALVSFLDDRRQWFKAAQGLVIGATEREIAFCNHAVASGELFVVNDTSADARFERNPLVAGDPHARFYAGIPLAVEPGVYVGTLCLLDTKPRQFTGEEAARLAQLAGMVTALIRQHRNAVVAARIARDLEAQLDANARQTVELARYTDLFDRASALTKSGAWEWTVEGDAYTWTDGMYDILELPRGGPIDWTQSLESYAPQAREELRALHAKSLRERSGFTFEGEATTAKGNKRWVLLTADVEIENGAVIRRFGMKQDITEQKAARDKMRYLAECDHLTGLPNRTILQNRLRDLPRSGPGSRDSTALLLIDLDGFKHLNDTFGHAVGDECLKQIATRIQRAFDRADMVARLGGDEFAVLLRAAKNRSELEDCAIRLLTELRRPVRWRGQSFQLSGSVGVAVADSAEDRSAQLFIEADLALYAAKAAGRNVFRIFAQPMKLKADARFQTIRDITSALRENQLELFYQPKVKLREGGLAGFEALLRWRRPDGQVVAAGAFADALEDPELSAHIGRWVVAAALRQGQAWREAGLLFGHIAINLSAGQFNEPQFAARLIQMIADHGLEPDMIEVEVTEGVFLNQGEGSVIETLKTLKDGGIRIALDDFGTGYASLTHLRAYPVDIIKIDKSFVQHALSSVQDNAILEATMFLARGLKLDVVAEGIEEPAQREFLKRLGCRYGQGYLFSKALCAAEAAAWCLPELARAG